MKLNYRSTEIAVRDSVWRSVQISISDFVRDSVRDSVWRSVQISIRTPVWSSVRVRVSVWDSVDEKLK